jgi:hypothetical protein
MSHWDFMLESDDSLRTWALGRLPRAWHSAQLRTVDRHPECPSLSASDVVDAEQLGAHRLAYLDYEGPVSGDRGEVTRIDRGEYVGDLESRRCWRIELVGGILQGAVMLQQDVSVGTSWQVRCLE